MSDEMTVLRCERCGYERQAELLLPDGEHLTGEQYADLVHAAGGLVLCDECSTRRPA